MFCFFRITAQLEEVQLEAGRTTEETRYYSVPPNSRSGTPREEEQQQQEEEDKNIYEIVDTDEYRKVDSNERPLDLVRPNFPPPPPPPAAAAANPSDTTYTAVYSCVKKGATTESADDEKVL